MSTDMIRSDGEVYAGAIVPVMTVDQALARWKQLQEIAGKLLRDGHDYGIIPGTAAEGKQPKKTLLKPGAEKLGSFFGLVPVFDDAGSIVDFPSGMIHYAKTCCLLRNARREVIDGRAVMTGDLIATAAGSCNSREKKYRRGAKVCPQCSAAAIKRSKYPPRDAPDDPPGWYCDSKGGGCGSQFAADDEEIAGQTMGIDPLSAADMANTILRMAEKRAFVAAMLIATNASDSFTDMEVDEQEQHGNGSEQEPAPRNPPPAKPQQPKFIPSDLIEIIREWLAHHHLSEAKCCQHFKVASLDKLNERQGNDAYTKAEAGFAGWKADREPGIDSE